MLWLVLGHLRFILSGLCSESASKGCIIVKLDSRQRIWSSNDHLITVSR
jgi:hypothetical protein